jgi:hypothetical protein
MDREMKKKVAAALAALLYMQEEGETAGPSRWAASGREQIMRDRARIAAGRAR